MLASAFERARDFRRFPTLAQTKPERTHTRHTPDVCAHSDHLDMVVYKSKNDINTVSFLTQTARFVS